MRGNETTWGDGHNKTRKHEIVENRQRVGAVQWIGCKCGTLLRAVTNDELSQAWRAHGGSVMALEIQEFDVSDSDKARAIEAGSEALLYIVNNMPDAAFETWLAGRTK